MSNTLKLGNGQWATGKDTVLSFSDTNNNYKPLPFSFSRNSSATVINKDGLIETVGVGEPRIDFKDNTKGALKLEPSRSNVNTDSEQFSNQLQGASATFGTIISPDGTLNGSTIASTVDGSYKGWHKTYNLTDDTYTFSMFVKYYNSQWISIYRIGQVISRFDVKNGVFGSNPSNLKSVNYGNGWYRLEFTFTAESGTNWLYIYPSSDIGETSFNGDGLYIWGGQLEQGSYATSYIPTSGQSGGVTRVADSSSQTVPDGVIGQTEGTVYWEINVETTVATANENILNIDNGSGFGHTIYFIKSVTGDLTGEMYVSGGLQASFTKTNITKGVHKMAMGYANNNTAFFVDGVQVSTTDTSCTVPLMSRIQLGNGVFGASDCLSNDVKLYNTRLSNSELAALTTI